MTKPEIVELSPAEMEAISAGYGSSKRPRLGGLILLLLVALLLGRRTVVPATEAAAV